MFFASRCPEAFAVLTRFAACVLGSMLFATSALAGTVSLAWDPVVSAALRGYMVHYGPAAGSYTTSVDVGNVTSHAVPNLTEGSTYHFAVTAYDAARTQSGFSNNVTATVPFAVPVADFTASTTTGPAPLAMNFINGSSGAITTHAWTFGDGTTSSSPNPTKTYLVAGIYTVVLTVTGPGGTNTKTRTSYITVTGVSDTTPPTTPASLTAIASGTSTINLSWSTSTDNVGVTGYRIERCPGASCTNFTQIATSTTTTFGNTGLSASTAYRYRVRAHDAAGNVGGYSPIGTATTTAAADTTPPTAPSSITATASGASTINLSWPASTDNVGVTGYRIERCLGASCTNFTQIATSTTTTFGSTGLSASTAYRYRVRAHDAAGNVGGYSPVATATTTVAGDTTPPTIPTNLNAVLTGGGSAAVLWWTVSSDNVGVAGYRIERCQGSGCNSFVQIGTSSTWYSMINGLLPGTVYRFRVRAVDTAGNLSGFSAIFTVTP